jgi:hypothetical protein
MAERIRFRASAAKVGVSVAFLALVGGLVDRLRPSHSAVRVTPAATTGQFLKLHGIPGDVKRALIKLEDKWIKLDSALSTVVHKLTTDYLKIDSANSEFLKIRAAGLQYMKIVAADAEFLKIRAANVQFLKIRDANSEFLKTTDANSQFLKIDDAKNEFLQGQGSVVSGSAELSTTASSPTPVLQSPDGLITVSAQATQDRFELFIQNDSSDSRDFVVDEDAGAPGQASSPLVESGTIKAGDKAQFLLSDILLTRQFHVQLFPSANFPQAMTLVLSSEPMQNNQVSVVGQLLIGLL